MTRLKTVLIPLVLALLVATSGCSMFANQNNTPTNTPTPGASDYPPGVSEQGLESATALLSAHTSELRNSSFTGTYSREFSPSDINATFTTTTTTKYAGNSILRVVNSSTSTSTHYVPTVSSTADPAEQTMYTQVETSQLTFYKETIPINAFEMATRATVLEQALPAFEYNTQLNDNGTVTLTSTTLTNSSTLTPIRDVTSVSDASLTLVVTPEGVIKSFTLSVSSGDGTTTISGQLSNIGSTQVSKPSWVSQAKQNHVQVQVNVTEQKSQLKLTYSNGPDIPKGANFIVSPPSGQFRTQTLDFKLTSGNSYYIGIKNGNVTLSKDLIKTDSQLDPGTYLVLLSTDEGTIITQSQVDVSPNFPTPTPTPTPNQNESE